MRSQRQAYRTLDDLYSERDAVAWYWRLIALVASWGLLGGFLLLPSTFDEKASLRFSTGVLTIFIVAFLTTGYSLTVLLWFAVRSPLFRSESIFLPALCSCGFGLLATLYCFASSTRYDWNAASGATIALSAFSSVTYGILVFLTQKQITWYKSVAGDSHSQHDLVSHRASSTSQEQSYYTNYVANMYPTARASSASSAYDIPPAAASPVPPTLSEDDLVNQQMALLLRKADAAPSPDASQSTFRIDWPGGNDEENQTFRPSQRASRAPNSHEMGLQSPRHDITTPEPGRTRSRSGPLLTTDFPPSSRHDRSNDRGRSAGRPDSQPSGRVRTKSRDDRRREIELGMIR
ncbi:hypothetical protein K402DRAFT_421272 [Aulographum hederae CBS 113979]|uniref:Uncharacterized protein n=1 Tax=Aulographum hederae CBS 113979 TaxID=1176131 RepID=A0A6G1GZM8_9PEZI|nr:hypothetical protein K402DRAFT_421272 [Aulographum hederae CBS 113979]